MYLTVIPEGLSTFTAHGLTYWSEEAIKPGTLVSIPLRKKTVAGLVIHTAEEKPDDDMDVKPIIGILRSNPLLMKAQLQTLLWMCQYYYCSPRSALQVFLPSPPWTLLKDKESAYFSLLEHSLTKKKMGKNQEAILSALKEKSPREECELLHVSHASKETLKTLAKHGIVKCSIRKTESHLEKKEVVKLPTQFHAHTKRILDEERPTLFVTQEDSTKRLQLYLALAIEQWNQGKSSMILFPDIFSAEAAQEFFMEAIPHEYLELLHSRVKITQKRRITERAINGEQMIILGTRTGLFIPLEKLGLIVLDREHEWLWKNEQKPKYHARLTAEILAKGNSAKLLMTSAMPSLDSIRHTVPLPNTTEARYDLLEEVQEKERTHNVQVIDLKDANFGSIYPFTAPLVRAIEDRLTKKEVSVLLLNRRGTGSGLLCMECKQTVNAMNSTRPLAVITRDKKPWLLDREKGTLEPVPLHCSRCQSVQLKVIGAGTERLEELTRKLFPHAEIVRADSDTLNQATSMKKIIRAIEEGSIDILLGTQPVLAALQTMRVTLAAMLLADSGLSSPDFRAGERVFQTIITMINAMQKIGGMNIIQTFRPDAPEIRAALQKTPLTYAREEIDARIQAGYPPAVQMIELTIREDEARALSIFNQLQKTAENLECKITLKETYTLQGFRWHIVLRGKRVRELINTIDTRQIIIDVDPM